MRFPFLTRGDGLGRLRRLLARRPGGLGVLYGRRRCGKSRLIREFAQASVQTARLIRGRCLSYGEGITFWPLSEAIRDAAAVASEDSPATATEKVRSLLAILDEHVDRGTAVLAATHDERFLAAFATRVVRPQPGRLVPQGGVGPAAPPGAAADGSAAPAGSRRA